MPCASVHDVIAVQLKPPAHLEVNAIELIKAGPGARGSQAFEEFGHRQVVQGVTAVEHHALASQGLG